MGFWGIEVKPGIPHSYRHDSDDVPGKLHVTQATLGSGSGKEKSVLQCSIKNKSPIYLCSLLPNKNECCPLNLEFDDDDNVSFSVIGQQSVHLSGYFKRDEQDLIRDEDDLHGIDITETDSDESSDYGTGEDYEDDFIDDDDDDLPMYPPSSARNSGVVIEEIIDEDEPSKESQPKRSKKKNLSSEDENIKKQLVAKGSSQAPDLESEDEDGFPISKSESSEAVDKTDEMMQGIDNSNQVSYKKRKAKTTEQDGVLESDNKKKKKKQKEKQRLENANGSIKEADEQQKDKMPKEEETLEINRVSSDQNENETVNNVMDMDKNGKSETAVRSAEKKKKRKKKKTKNQEDEGAKDINASSGGDKEKLDSTSQGKEANSKSSHVRTYPNGFIVEELAMGKPDGKRASPGKQVSVRYIGKLQKNGKIFDSNIGKAPLKFRLGVGQVIKGWDVGVNGMRIGDKRKLTIPPSMGYGQHGAGGKIPPNAWLVFDVELVDVR